MRPSAHTDKYPSRSARSSGTGDEPQPVAAPRTGRRRPRGLARLPLLVLIPFLVGLFGGSIASVGADELSDAKARESALAKQLRQQKEEVAQINALQADLSTEISTTRRQLSGINADLSTVKKSINTMVGKIDVVRKTYLAQVGKLQQLDIQLDRITVEESVMTVNLRERKALLAERLRQAYDTDRTSMLETFLSAGSFTDVLSEVSYTIDVGEQDRALAEQIVGDQAALASIHQSVTETRSATDELRIATAAQKVKLDAALKELKAAQAELKRLEIATARALAIQKAAYRKLAANKQNLAKAMAITAKARTALARQISDLVAQQYALGNIPSEYNGQFVWPLRGDITGEFGCSSYQGYGPGYGCENFHNGIDIVARGGCGAPIKAAGDGRIAYIGWNYADGPDPAWIVIIAHSQNLQTWYAHMKGNSYPGGIVVGSTIRAGQAIGYEASTGNSTGCHLHWMVEFEGSWRNPRLFV